MTYASVQLEDYSDRVCLTKRERWILMRNHESFFLVEMAHYRWRNSFIRTWFTRQTFITNWVSQIKDTTTFFMNVAFDWTDMKMVQYNSGMWLIRLCHWFINWKQVIIFKLNKHRLMRQMKKHGHHFERFDRREFALNSSILIRGFFLDGFVWSVFGWSSIGYTKIITLYEHQCADCCWNCWPSFNISIHSRTDGSESFRM